MIPPALARRRAHEALREERLAYVDHNAKASQVVSFEHRTAKRIAATNICRKAAIFRQQDLQKLQDRQKAMEELYKREMAEWEQQVKEKNRRKCGEHQDKGQRRTPVLVWWILETKEKLVPAFCQNREASSRSSIQNLAALRKALGVPQSIEHPRRCR